MIQAAQAENPHREPEVAEAFAFSTELARDYGLRAKELITIRKLEELEKSGDPKDRAILEKLERHADEWHEDRWHGMPDGVDYVVIGKGGGPCIKQLSRDHARRLEARPLPVPLDVSDRGNHYRQFYDIPGGRRWSDDFARMSKRVLGFSLGAHALRHAFADDPHAAPPGPRTALQGGRGAGGADAGTFQGPEHPDLPPGRRRVIYWGSSMPACFTSHTGLHAQ